MTVLLCVLLAVLAVALLLGLQYLANELGLLLADRRELRRTWAQYEGLHNISWNEFRRLPSHVKWDYLDALDDYVTSAAEHEGGCC